MDSPAPEDDDVGSEDNSGEDDEMEVDEVVFGRKIVSGKGITLSKLLNAGILQPGEGVMSIDYLGKTFIGDLVASGKIRWQETKEMFNSPSAWAIRCKKIVNPDKKSGCGWNSIKYQGKKLDIYKSMWYKNMKPDEFTENRDDNEETRAKENKFAFDSANAEKKSENSRNKFLILKHANIGFRSPNHNPSTLVQCLSFMEIGRIQPFTVTISSNCLFLMNFHCHLTKNEVIGYLGGYWDVHSHNLALQQAFPCKCNLNDNASLIEEQIRATMEKRHLTLVGWYHSHPTTVALPSLRDIDCQLDYEIKMKGNSDASYTPCVGVIKAPYYKESDSLETTLLNYWVIPPPENRPLEYGKPMHMSYAISSEPTITQDVKEELNELANFYKASPDLIPFNSKWHKNLTYYEKLLSTIALAAPADQTETTIDQLINPLLMKMISKNENSSENEELKS